MPRDPAQYRRWLSPSRLAHSEEERRTVGRRSAGRHAPRGGGSRRVKLDKADWPPLSHEHIQARLWDFFRTGIRLPDETDRQLCWGWDAQTALCWVLYLEILWKWKANMTYKPQTNIHFQDFPFFHRITATNALKFDSIHFDLLTAVISWWRSICVCSPTPVVKHWLVDNWTYFLVTQGDFPLRSFHRVRLPATQQFKTTMTIFLIPCFSLLYYNAQTCSSFVNILSSC